MRREPLVTIGLPTYNRAATLPRAIASALGQTHANLQLIICDNASSDATEEICRQASAADPRVRYLRQPHNVGPTANFNRLFDTCDGDYVLMLADDDWLDARYVEACLEALGQDPSLAMVAGRPRYHGRQGFSHEGVAHNHLDHDPARRVRAYLATVDDNGVFYGVMRNATIKQVRPLPNVLGNDWLHVARIAFLGGIRTLPGPNVHRAMGGTSADVGRILATFRGPAWQAWAPQLVIGWQLLADIGWRHPVYAGVAPLPRLILGARGAWASVRWRHLAWHLVTPLVAWMSARPGGGRLWTSYLRLTRALGAGRSQAPASTRR